MMMVFTKAKLAMARNMDWANITLKTVTFMKEKCIKE